VSDLRVYLFSGNSKWWVWRFFGHIKTPPTMKWRGCIACGTLPRKILFENVPTYFGGVLTSAASQDGECGTGSNSCDSEAGGGFDRISTTQHDTGWWMHDVLQMRVDGFWFSLWRRFLLELLVLKSSNIRITSERDCLYWKNIICQNIFWESILLTIFLIFIEFTFYVSKREIKYVIP
jgi:hypothetical protein